MEALNDQDKDGLSNREEWLADTDPTNAESVQAMVSVQNANGLLSLGYWRPEEN